MFLRLDDCIFNAFLSFGNLHQDYIKILFERNYKIAVGFFQLHKLILEKLHQGTNPSPQPPAPLLEQPRVRAPKLGLGLGLSASLLKMHFLVSPPSGLGSLTKAGRRVWFFTCSSNDSKSQFLTLCILDFPQI